MEFHKDYVVKRSWGFLTRIHKNDIRRENDVLQ